MTPWAASATDHSGSGMKRNLWLAVAAAAALIIGSVLISTAGMRNLPGLMIFVAALMIIGVSMMLEDALLLKYDTPHEEDRHPPLLTLFRLCRAIIVSALGVLFFVRAM